uniref:Integrase, catalytic region, zinc finger, CCHC-type, peptidase aspartic, catalytic n=1 Tax=Tanacetum cinerariifolium TaxID=118510 RepID=A0A699HY31_TANCI|nr:integrase, catalytic region, zinc finger, CCHC-type, peptidase aspartic, catalytic [Tanacetum cinerariifolium]
MANLSEDIQCAGLDTQPPLLDMTDFTSWKQRIRLYCQGKENEVNILKSINEGPFQMAMFREVLPEGEEGAFHLGLERPRVYSNLSPKKKDRVNRIEVRGTMHRVQVQLVMKELRTELGMQIWVKQGRLNKMLLMQAQENGVALDEELLLFTAADDYDAFDSNVDEASTAQTTFMANLSFAYLVYDEAGPSYDLDILSENNVVDKSLTIKLATYKEHVKLYKRWAKFELTEREQKIDEQLRIVITDHNIKEENLKKELHSVKMQVTSTINQNNSMVEVTSLKKEFKQKENKYLEDFLDVKALKEKVEYKLYKQDRYLQTVHMLCKPKSYYDE